MRGSEGGEDSEGREGGEYTAMYQKESDVRAEGRVKLEEQVRVMWVVKLVKVRGRG